MNVLAHLAASADEAVTEAGLFVSIALGARGVIRFRRDHAIGTRGAVYIAVAVALAAVAIVLPPRLIRRAPPAAARLSSPATIAIEAPLPDAVVTGRRMTVRIDVAHASIVSFTSTHVRADQGHVHLSIDGITLLMTANGAATVDLAGFKPGKHVLEAEFVAADHFPFRPRVLAAVPFVMR